MSSQCIDMRQLGPQITKTVSGGDRDGEKNKLLQPSQSQDSGERLMS